MNPADSNSEKFYDSGDGIGVYRSGAVHLTLSWAQSERKAVIGFAEKCRHLIFDLSDTRFIDSVALALFLDVHRVMSEKDGLVALAAVRPIVQKGFTLLQLPLLIGETIDDARMQIEA